MSINLTVNQTEVKIDKFPDICPQCHCHIEPTLVNGHIRSNPLQSSLLQIVFKCTHGKCNKLFISNYRLNSFDEVWSQNYVFNYSEPKKFKETSFKEDIRKLSPSFQSIYNQASAAESIGLTEICGAGYRKALEFLVKDYLIHLYPEREEEIKEKFLGKCISMISDENIRFCSERATWLGNDETHYIRKWEEKDLTNLKELIHLTINWVSNELMMEKYRKEMPEGK